MMTRVDLLRFAASVGVLSAGCLAVALASTSFGGDVVEDPSAAWPQWGGPSGDFKVAGPALADRWPEKGLRRLWSRPLGEGFSAIVADSTKLYTMYRRGDDEVVAALQARSGETIWEHSYSAKPYPSQTAAYGAGPNAAPLLVADRLVTIGSTGIMHCLDAASGGPIWSHDLVKEFNSKIQYYGYSTSPIFYNNTIITLVGGEGYGVVAFNPADGSLVWKSKTCDVSYAPPILIDVDGQAQVVFFSPTEVIGIDARNGSFLWSHKVINFCRTNCTPAIWGEDNLLWAATKGVGGTRVLKLSQRDGKTSVKEVWLNRKIRLYHWNAVRIGDYVYTSSGDNKMFLSVIDVNTGEVVDRQRGFGSTNAIYADGKLILLDDSGKLALARVSPGKLEVVSSVRLFDDSVCWTVPTLVGKTLYVRNRRSIAAFDLG